MLWLNIYVLLCCKSAVGGCPVPPYGALGWACQCSMWQFIYSIKEISQKSWEWKKVYLHEVQNGEIESSQPADITHGAAYCMDLSPRISSLLYTCTVSTGTCCSNQQTIVQYNKSHTLHKNWCAANIYNQSNICFQPGCSGYCGNCLEEVPSSACCVYSAFICFILDTSDTPCICQTYCLFLCFLI